ncbi:hypothetical protein EDD15DRAFT_2372095 [Pisolithus albus]|nr:hypothetical protein EDD15DRAFT_2372095 [Pisolithus albus]
MVGKAQQLRLCTCKVVGCGSKRHWSPSRLESTPGQWISKAMCARHRKIDQLSCYLEGSPNESETVGEPTTSIGVPRVPDDVCTLDRGEPPATFPNPGSCAGSTPPMPHWKEETDAVEATLYDLMHLCSAVTHRAMSFPSDLNLVFSEDCPPGGSTYNLFSSIPHAPNMGHRSLHSEAPENAAIMAHECELFRIFSTLKHLDPYPLLEVSRLQLVALVENEIYRVDSLRQLAWNRSKDDNPDIEHSRKSFGITFNTVTVALRTTYKQSVCAHSCWPPVVQLGYAILAGGGLCPPLRAFRPIFRLPSDWDDYGCVFWTILYGFLLPTLHTPPRPSPPSNSLASSEGGASWS